MSPLDDAGLNDLPPDLASRVRAELDSGERLVWVGQPRPDLYVRKAFVLVPCGVFFAGFAVFWIAMATGILGFAKAQANAPPAPFGLFAVFPLCGLPFVLIGLGMIASPVWLRVMARKTVYALTDRRAIVWEPAWVGNPTVRSYAAAGLGKMSRVEGRDGAGDLVFEEFTTTSRDSHGNVNRTTTRRGFLAISEVRKVEELVRLTLLG